MQRFLIAFALLFGIGVAHADMADGPPSRTRQKPFQAFVVTATNPTWNIVSHFGYVPTTLIIEAWSGGASGSGQNGGTNTGRGAGGGGGSYVYFLYTGIMDATLNITVGAGGASCSSSCGGNSGGGTSVVGTNLGTISLNGGNANGCSGANCQGGVGATCNALPVTGTGFCIPGGGGGATLTSVQNYFGVGGDAPRGGNGAKYNVSVAGDAPGGGGSGENHTGGGSGAGARGQVIIWGQ